MDKDQSNKNLQKTSFKDKDLSLVNFSGSDIRGADFSGADLTGADFTKSRTGITVANVVLIFFIALAVSLISGYVATLAGQTIQQMMASEDSRIRTAGITTIVLTILFIIYCYWKGGGKAIRNFIIPLIIVSIVIGVIANVSGWGTGRGMLYQILALLLVVVMFVIGTIARAAAGVLSGILFLIVALSGGMFGRSIGGGIGTVIMAIACMQISKRALSGAKGFETLRMIASFITKKFGTSFRNSKLKNANFLQSRLRNADFSNADVSSVNWGDSKKINCISSEKKFTAK